MGTTAHVVVVGDGAVQLAQRAVDEITELERKWSRFRSDSEISRANAHAGSHVVVSPETLLLVERSIEGWERSGGVFDPTVLPALERAGYDRDYTYLRGSLVAVGAESAKPSPGCGGFEVDAAIGAITVPPNVAIDPGGIGKGLAADLVSANLVAAGARAALVNVGGDLRARGEPFGADAWEIALEDPARPERTVLRFGIRDGAVATSSRVKRRWRTTRGTAHHLIDPRSGAPSRSRHATVMAVTADAWWAEVVAKTVLLDERGIGAGPALGARLVTVDDTGAVSYDAGAFGVAA
jgi:thiamine biosynthesis lipoprotein